MALLGPKGMRLNLECGVPSVRIYGRLAKHRKNCACCAIAQRLTSVKPTDRPMMSEVLQWMSKFDLRPNVN